MKLSSYLLRIFFRGEDLQNPQHRPNSQREMVCLASTAVHRLPSPRFAGSAQHPIQNNIESLAEVIGVTATAMPPRLIGPNGGVVITLRMLELAVVLLSEELVGSSARTVVPYRPFPGVSDRGQPDDGLRQTIRLLEYALREASGRTIRIRMDAFVLYGEIV